MAYAPMHRLLGTENGVIACHGFALAFGYRHDFGRINAVPDKVSLCCFGSGKCQFFISFATARVIGVASHHHLFKSCQPRAHGSTMFWRSSCQAGKQCWLPGKEHAALNHLLLPVPVRSQFLFEYQQVPAWPV